MKIVQWVLSRVSEPSSYAAVAAGVIGVGILTGFEWLAVIGVVGGIIGVVMAEKNQD
jgi:O-antigen ligase|tara:strand:- start:430 stop:600 length:171 start_codon:yes stop_codon:yes gene_type:complete